MLDISDDTLKVISSAYLALLWADNPLTCQDISSILISQDDGG